MPHCDSKCLGTSQTTFRRGWLEKKKKIHINKGYYAEDEKNEEQLYTLIQSGASDRVMGGGGG